MGVGVAVGEAEEGAMKRQRERERERTSGTYGNLVVAGGRLGAAAETSDVVGAERTLMEGGGSDERESW